MRCIRAITLWMMIAACAAQAGPWMRETGTGFFALSGTITADMDQSYSGYIEYGLRDRLTLGADVDLTLNTDGALSGGGLIFAQRPIGMQTWRSTYRLGLGARDVDGKIAPFVSAGYSLGRGISPGARSGWIALDTRLDLGASDVSQAKIDATFGLNFGARGKGLIQLFTTLDADSTVSATLAPSYVYQRRPDGPSYQIGLELKNNQAEPGVKLGLWRDF